MLAFCIRSLFKEYGWQFLWHVALPHPIRTAKAVLLSSFGSSMENITNPTGGDDRRLLGSKNAIVGVGFCLKPLDPPCPSDRFNHDCQYLERLDLQSPSEIPESCRHCLVSKLGLMTLQAGAAYYIMTSAQDILFDVFKPAIIEGCYTSGIFALCRYSMRPFAVGLAAAGINGKMLPYENGACANYHTWLQADRGIKNEQTTIDSQNLQRMEALLSSAVKEPSPYLRYEKRGRVFFPIKADRKDFGQSNLHD